MTATPPVRTLVVPRAGEPDIVEITLPPLPGGDFHAQTLVTGLSAGTELTWHPGTSPYFQVGWDTELGLFDRDRPMTRFPVRRLGHMDVARVTDSRTPAVSEGTVVVMAHGHSTAVHGDPLTQHVVPLPPALDPLLGVYVGRLGPIWINGLLHAAADAGGSELRDGVSGRLVPVTGGGSIGLLVGLLTRVHGAAEVVVDPTPERRTAARAVGLEAVDDTLALLEVHGASIRAELLTDVVPFDEAPDLFAALSARRRHVVTAVLRVPER